MGSNAFSSGMAAQSMRGMIWMFFGANAQAILQLVTLAILARFLTPEEFGLVGAGLIVAQFSEIVSFLGVGAALVRHPDIGPHHVRTGFTLSLLLGLSLYVVLWGISPFVAKFFRIAGLAPLIRTLALMFPILGLSAVAESIMRRDLRFMPLAKIMAGSNGLYGIVAIGLAMAGTGAWALVAANIARVGYKTIHLLVIQPHPKRLQIDRKSAKELLHFGGGLTISRVLNYFAIQGDNIIVGRWLGAGALGIYGRAYSLMSTPTQLTGNILHQVLFSAMARVQDEPDRLRTAYRRGISFISISIMPAGITLFVMAPEFISVLLGSKWLVAVLPFRILALGMFFRTSYKISGSLILAKGAVYRHALRQGGYALMVVGGALIGQAWGLAGVATGVVIALAANFIAMAHLSSSLISMSWVDFGKAHIPGMFLALVAGLETWALSSALRAVGASSIAILIAGTLTIVVTFGALIRIRPEFSIGKDGVWVLRKLVEYGYGRHMVPKLLARGIDKLLVSAQ